MTYFIRDMFSGAPTMFAPQEHQHKQIRLQKSRKAEYRRTARALEQIAQYPLEIKEETTSVLQPYQIDITHLPSTMTTYNVWRRNKQADTIVCFYIQDHYFARLLHDDEAMDDLKKAACVVTPDCSQYSDMDEATRRHNNLLNKHLAVKMQQRGINIVYNLTWSLPDSFDYCFNGIPYGSTVAINSNGIKKNAASKYLWLKGYNEALARFNPQHILRYGPKIAGENERISLYYENVHISRMRK